MFLKKGNHYFSQLGPITRYSSDLAPTFNIMLNPNIKISIPNYDNLLLEDVEFINIFNEFDIILNLDIKSEYDNFINKLIYNKLNVRDYKINNLNLAFYIWIYYMKNDSSMDEYFSSISEDVKITFTNYLIGNSNIYSLGFNILQSINKDLNFNFGYKINNTKITNIKKIKIKYNRLFIIKTKLCSYYAYF